MYYQNCFCDIKKLTNGLAQLKGTVLVGNSRKVSIDSKNLLRCLVCSAILLKSHVAYLSIVQLKPKKNGYYHPVAFAVDRNGLTNFFLKKL